MTPWLEAGGQAAFYRQIVQMDQCYTDEIEPYYGPCDFPVRILWGEDDAWIPIDHGRRLAEALTGGDPVTIPRAGHLVPEEAPEAIVAAMLA